MKTTEFSKVFSYHARTFYLCIWLPMRTKVQTYVLSSGHRKAHKPAGIQFLPLQEKPARLFARMGHQNNRHGTPSPQLNFTYGDRKNQKRTLHVTLARPDMEVRHSASAVPRARKDKMLWAAIHDKAAASSLRACPCTTMHVYAHSCAGMHPRAVACV